MNTTQDTLLHSLFEEVLADPSVSWGNTNAVCIRDAFGQTHVHPQSATGSSSLADLSRTLDAVVAFKTQSTYVHTILIYSQADSDRILLDSGVSIPVVDESLLVPEACRGTNAAILRDEESLVLWSHSVSTIAQEYRELSHRLQHYVGECFCASISQRIVLNSIPSISVFSRCDFDFDFSFLSNTGNDSKPLSSHTSLGHVHSLTRTDPKLTSIYLDSPSSLSPEQLPVNESVLGVKKEYVPKQLLSPTPVPVPLMPDCTPCANIDSSPRTLTLSEISPPPKMLQCEDNLSTAFSIVADSFTSDDEDAEDSNLRSPILFEEDGISELRASSPVYEVSDEEEESCESTRSYRYVRPTYGKCKPDGEHSWRASVTRFLSPHSTTYLSPLQLFPFDTPESSSPKRPMVPLPTRRSGRHLTLTPPTPTLSPPSPVLTFPISAPNSPNSPRHMEVVKVYSDEIDPPVSFSSTDPQTMTRAGATCGEAIPSALSDTEMEIDGHQEDVEDDDADEYAAESDDDDDEFVAPAPSVTIKATIPKAGAKRRRRKSGSSQKKKQKFSCAYCDKTFTREADSRRHSKSACKKSPNVNLHACVHCDQKFNRDDALARHVRTKHRNLFL